MNLVTNERQILADVLENHIFDRKPTLTIRVLIKHYFGQGCTILEVRERLEQQMASLPGYHALKWDKKLTAMVKTLSEQSYELIHVDRIEIVQAELDRIASLRQPELEKLAFVLLAYAKVKNRINPDNDGWVSQASALLLREAGIRKAKASQRMGELPDRDNCLHELVKHGLITPTRIVDREDVRVNFAQESGEAVFEIRDFREVVHYYARWKGQRYANCSSCSIIYRSSSNNSKYCAACKREKELQWKRDNIRKRRMARVE